MRFAGPFLIAALLVAAAVRAQDSTGAAVASADMPYASIVARNMFGLLPIPPPDTNPPAAPVDPPPKITLNGIMTIFGRDQALFKVANKPKPGQPPKDDSFVMSEGEMQNEITVQKINHVDGVVTFNNHGTIQEMPLVAAANGSGPASGGGGPGAGNPAIATRGLSGADRLAAIRAQAAQRAASAGMPNPIAPPPPAAGNAGNPAGVAGLGFNSEVNANGIYQPKADTSLTPEQSVVLIEAQRMKMLQEGNPKANLLPTTPLTEQNVRENGMQPQ